MMANTSLKRRLETMSLSDPIRRSLLQLNSGDNSLGVGAGSTITPRMLPADAIAIGRRPSSE